MTNEIRNVVASMRGTFTTRDIASLLSEDVKLDRIRHALRSMKHVVKVSKGTFKAKGRSVPGDLR